MSETTDLLRKLRDGGLSQTEISKLTGIPQPRLSRWASGEAPDSADDALKLKALVDGLHKQPISPPGKPAVPATEAEG